MEVLTNLQRGLFFAGLLIILGILYNLGHLIDGFLIRKENLYKHD